MSHSTFPARLAFAACSIALLLATDSAVAQCGATVSTPAFNANWTIQNSPYCVTQTIQVGNLTIDPGVEIRMAPGASLQVVSWLRANGTREQPVVFRAQNLAQGRWGGIEFAGPVAPNNASSLSHCVVTEAGDSGVRILNNDQVTLQGCSIRNNTSALNGGGLRVQLTSGFVTAFACEIENNQAAHHGGGVHATTSGGATFALADCLIQGNLANPSNAAGNIQGGGIWSSGNLALLACKVAGNRAATQVCFGSIAARGGGIYATNGDVFVANSVVVENECSATTSTAACGGQSGISEGGGLWTGATIGSLTVRNSLVCCNSASASGPGTAQRGSGVFTAAATASLENCTVARNWNQGIHVASGSTGLSNSIVFHHSIASIQGTAVATYSNIEGSHPGTGNINFNPVFSGPGCEPEHFALQPFSPCIDAGDPAASANDSCRPPAQGTGRNDIGALGGPGNCGFTGPSVIVCGAQTYGTLMQPGGDITLDWNATGNAPPHPGTISIGNGTPSTAGLMLISLAPANSVIGGVTILVDLSSVNPVPIQLNAQGTWSASINLQLPFLVGLPIFLQAIELPSGSAPRASNGLRVASCF